jgi:S1-C subfamily serine protease
VYTGPSSSGSGFAVSRDGLVLTNKHVVRACSAVQLRVDGTERRAATIVALDVDDDLALLRVSGTLPSVVRFRSGSAPRPGDDVVAAGFPLNGLLADEVNVTVGYISALAGLHNDQHELQMTAPVQPGSSGGPLFDASGNLVGVVVTKLNARLVAETTGDLPQNVNFAIKGTVAREFLEANGVRVETAPTGAARSHADVGDVGRAVTMLVECYR